MRNNSVNKDIFHFLGARIWMPVPLYWYENRSAYITGNMCNLFHDAILFHLKLPNFLLKFEYCKKQRSSLGKTKSIFHYFLRALFW